MGSAVCLTSRKDYPRKGWWSHHGLSGFVGGLECMTPGLARLSKRWGKILVNLLMRWHCPCDPDSTFTSFGPCWLSSQIVAENVVCICLSEGYFLLGCL